MALHLLRSPPDRTPPLPAQDLLLYYNSMNRRKRTSETAMARWLYGGGLPSARSSPPSPPPSPPTSTGGRTEAAGSISPTTSRPSPRNTGERPSRSRKRRPKPGGRPFPRWAPPPRRRARPFPLAHRAESRPITGDPGERRATAAEKLRAKVAAKEQFLRGVDEKQSLATNPYRNRIVSSSDQELYKKYKEELPADREQLKAIESRLAPQGSSNRKSEFGRVPPVAPTAGVPHKREARSGAPYVPLRSCSGNSGPGGQTTRIAPPGRVPERHLLRVEHQARLPRPLGRDGGVPAVPHDRMAGGEGEEPGARSGAACRGRSSPGPGCGRRRRSSPARSRSSGTGPGPPSPSAPGRSLPRPHRSRSGLRMAPPRPLAGKGTARRNLAGLPLVPKECARLRRGREEPLVRDRRR